MEKYIIRINTAKFDQITLPTGAKIELVTADGLGMYAGKTMVKVGEVYESEIDKGLVHMSLNVPESAIAYAIEEVALNENRLRRGEIMPQGDRKGLWVPSDLLIK